MVKSLLKTVLLLCALVAGSGSAWADTDVVFTFTQDSEAYGWSGSPATSSDLSVNDVFTNGYVTFTYTAKGTGNTNLRWWSTGDGLRSYKGNKFKIATSYGTIEKITITGTCVLVETTNTGGTIASNRNWTKPTSGGITEVEFECNQSSGAKTIKTVTVTIALPASTDPSSAVAFSNTEPTLDLKDSNTYTQTATTADGYTGTVTYSMTANTAGASINEITGEVTVSQAGSVTVKATAPAVSGSWASSTATYTLTVNDTRTATTTTIVTTGIMNTDLNIGTAAGSLSANVTETTSGNAVSGATVTWESSNTSVAIIDEDGVVTLVAKGKTTISATFAETATHKGSSNTYELTVTNSGLINIALSNTLFGCSTGNVAAEQSKTIDNVTITTGCSSSAQNKTYYASDHIRFYADSYLTLDAPSGYAIIGVKLNRYNTDTWNGNKVTPSVGAFNETPTANTAPLVWSGAAPSVTFSYSGQCRTSSVDVTLSTKVPITVTDAGYATYVSDVDLDYSGLGVKAYRATVDGTNITFAKVTEVPAGEGVLLQGAGTFNVPMAASAVTAWATDYNAFVRGEGKAVATGSGPYNYILNKVDDVVGFYKANGQTVAKNRAYLQATTNQARIAFNLEDETAGIESAQFFDERSGRAERTVYNSQLFYNLNGQRVSSPKKGLYIMNGKKVIKN